MKLKQVLRYYWLLFVALILSISVRAQDPFHIQYTVENGLPSNNIYRIMQDSKGYLWFGTDKGACRYDGTHFQNFTIAEGVSDNVVLSCIEDKMGRIWFLTLNGLPSYFKNNKVYNAGNDLVLKNMDFDGPIKHGINDSLGNTWLIGKKVCRIGNDSIQFYDRIELSDNLSFTTECVIPAWLDNNGKLAFLNIINYKKVVYDEGFRFENPKDLPLYVKGAFSGGKQFGNNTVYVTSQNIYVTNFKGYERIIPFPNSFRPLTILVDKNLDLQISSNKGLWIYDNNIVLKRKIFKKEIVTNSYRDRQGNLWVATTGSGLMLIPNDNILVYKNSLFGNRIVNRLGLLDKTLILGSLGGQICQFNGYSISKLYESNTGFSPFEIITYGKNGTFIIYPEEFVSINNGNIINDDLDSKFYKTGYLAKDGTFYIAGGLGVSTYINGIITFNKLSNLPGRIFGIAEEGDKILLGTEKGLGFFKNGDYIPLKGNKLYNASVNMMRASDEQTLWIASRTDGIVVKTEDTIFSINKTHGLEAEITRLCITGNTIYAIGSSKVYRIKFHRNGKKITILNIQKLPYLPPMQIFDVLANDSAVWLATQYGIISYPVSAMDTKKERSNLLITGLSINHTDTTLHERYQLSYTQNNITINFVALSFRSFGNINYRYKIIQNDTKWFYTNQNAVSFSSLSPGYYNFILQAQNPDNTWSESQTIEFEITPPIWKQKWFYLLVFSIFGSVVVYTIRRKINRLKHDQELKNASLQAELLALRSQMNPHFIFNGLNSIQDFVLRNDKKEASIYLSEFAQLMRMSMENMRRQTLPISEEILFLTKYVEMEQLRLNNSFQFRVEIDEDINTEECDFPTMLLQPFIENAIHHGLPGKQNGVLILKFHKQGHNLICIVEDNGSGREKINSPKSHEHKSAALNIITSRIEKYNSEGSYKIGLTIEDLTDTEGLPSGTRILLNFYRYFR